MIWATERQRKISSAQRRCLSHRHSTQDHLDDDAPFFLSLSLFLSIILFHFSLLDRFCYFFIVFPLYQLVLFSSVSLVCVRVISFFLLFPILFSFIRTSTILFRWCCCFSFKCLYFCFSFHIDIASAVWLIKWFWEATSNTRLYVAHTEKFHGTVRTRNENNKKTTTTREEKMMRCDNMPWKRQRIDKFSRSWYET